MSLKVADRVKENTTTVGSGILNLVGNTDGFQRFTNVLASGDITYYCIEENNKFEVGIGTYVADTLTRDYILRSSSNGNKINLQGSGVVFITYPADKAVYKNQESQVIIGPSGLIFNDNSIQLTAAKSIDEFNYISGITINNQSDIVYLSGIAVNAEETLDINYVSGIATYASGQAINNKASITTNSNDIVYLSGLVVAAEESDSISYVSGVANYSSGQSIQNQQQILATSGWAANTFSTINNVNYISGVAIYSSGKSIQNTSDIIYLSGLVINAEESNDIAYVSGISVYGSGLGLSNASNIVAISGIASYASGQAIYNTNSIANLSTEINYVSGLAVLAEESLDISYVSGVAAYASGKTISNTNDIVYLSGLVVAAEETSAINYVSGIATYSSGQSIANQASIGNLTSNLVYVSGLAVLAEESIDVTYISGIAVYASGKIYNDTYVSGIAVYASGRGIANEVSINNINMNIVYLSGIATNAEETLDINYISGIAVYTSGKIYNDTYLSGIATYASGQSISNQSQINAVSGWADASFLRENSSPFVYLSGLVVAAEESADINYISGIAIYSSGQSIDNQQQITSVSGWATNTFATNNNLVYVSGISNYASGQSLTNQSNITSLNNDLVYISGLAVLAEESLDINYVSGIAVYSSGKAINNENTIFATSGWANSTFATNIDLQYVSGIAVYVSGNALYNVVEDTSPQLGGNLDTNNYYISGVGNIIGGTGLFSSLKINNIDVSVSGHTHIASDITNFNTAVSGLIPVKNIVAGTNISVTNVSGVYTINDISTSTTSAASIVTTVFNKTGAAMPKMTAVYLNGGQGDLPTIQKALAISDATSAATYGLTYETIDNMSTGRVIVLGALTGLNTDQFNPNSPHGNINGSILYLSPTISGALTTTKPYSPQHIVAIGTVVRTHQNEGVIEVRIQNGFELEELHNVAISGVTNGEFLQYNASSGLWLPSNSGYFNNLYLGANGLYFNDGTQQTTSGLPYGSGSLINRNTADIIYISGLVVAAEETTQINYVSGIAVYSSGLSVQNQSNIVAVSGLVPTISNSSDNRVLTSTGAGTGINAESNLTFDGTLLNVSGSGTFASGVNISNQTGSTIASFDANKNVISLATSTYPSLTELSYIKGVTSALQTQIDGKSSTSHTHGNITSAGAIGSTANLPLITTTAGAITVGSFGSTANTFCQGNDSRLSDSRAPTGSAGGDLTGTYPNPTLTTTGVTGGTYRSVTVDTKGRITAGTNPTTLSGYGITDVGNGTLTLNVSGTGLSGSASFTANQSGNTTFTVTSNATNANTGSTIVARDASGNFSAGTITATLSGNASTATTATRSTIEDTRAAQRTPNDYDDFRASYEFTNQFTGLADWHSGFTMQGWSNGYASWQIIGPASTSAHENFYLRSGINTSWNSMRTILHSGNYNSYSPTLTGGGASGTWGINVTGTAAGETLGTVTGRGTTTNSIVQSNASVRAPIFYDSNDTNFYCDPNGTSRFAALVITGSDLYVGDGVTSSIIRMRDSDEGERQLHCNSNRIGFLTQAGAWGSWCEDDGSWATDFAVYAPIFYDRNNTAYYLDPASTSVLNRVNPVGWDTSGRNYSREWIELPNFTGLLSGNNGAYFYPNNASYGAWRIAGTRGGWAGLEFDSTGAGQISLMMNSGHTGVHNNTYGWQWYWTGGAFYVSKATNGGGTIATVLDSSNYNSYAPTLTGGNASGTWGINITGNAATATNGLTTTNYTAYVTPKQGSVNAYASFNGSFNPPTFFGSYNIASVIRATGVHAGTGKFQINLLAGAVTNNTYSVFNAANAGSTFYAQSSITTSSYVIGVQNVAGAGVWATDVSTCITGGN